MALGLLLHIANIASGILPVRDAGGVRTILYRAAGVSIGRGSKLTHGVALYGPQIKIGRDVWISMQTMIVSFGAREKIPSSARLK